MIVCKFCQTTVLESAKQWGYHHQDSDSFEGSLRSQCVFCTRLAEGLGEIDPWFDHDLEVKSLFRWNVRQAAQIRETKSHVFVTFRPVSGRACGKMKSEDLSEITFYLFPEEGWPMSYKFHICIHEFTHTHTYPPLRPGRHT